MMKILLTSFYAASLFGLSALPATAQTARVIDLAGEWCFQLDPEDAGESAEWFGTALTQTIDLPGSLQERGFGDPPSIDTPWMGSLNDRTFFTEDQYAPYRTEDNFKFPYWLTPTKYYAGAAWYQRTVDIPEAWAGRRILLHLERPHWETRLWVDDEYCGSNNSLAAAHEYDLSKQLTPGSHTITIRVDNRLIIPIGINSHSISDHTQGNWNGLVGDLKLTASSPIYADQVQVIPDLANHAVTVKGRVQSITETSGKTTLSFTVKQAGGFENPENVGSATKTVDWSQNNNLFEVRIRISGEIRAWDEFDPALYQLTMSKGREVLKRLTFGMREVSVDGTQIVLNGRKIFLRGTLECCIFPITGYPPTDVPAWKRIMRIARRHGLNHLRFHSWTPPLAAFQAADQMGFYLYVECPTWANGTTSVGDGRPVDEWIYAEGDRILEQYGNHPSFIMMSYGNEPGGRNQQQWLGELVEYWKKKDPRRLYTSGAGWPMIPENEFHVTPGARAFPVRAELGETAGDYSGYLARQDKPIVSHEIGQYCVFPNLDEIPKYTGWLQARNFEIVRDFLEAGGLLHQAEDFLLASGKFQTLFYKDEIEACLRTDGWAGFELLDLHDFPGQGTALVGMLDPFWDEKGYVTAREFRRFCDETVPLARLPKRIWTQGETLIAPVDVAHFGATDLTAVSARWMLNDADGKTIAKGQFETRDIPTGSLTRIGEVEVELAEIDEAAALNLVVSLPGTRFSNDWNLWVYPAQTASSSAPADVDIEHQWNEEVLRKLESGKSVVLFADPRTIAGDTVGRFDPIFWNKMWFPSQPQHTLGLLVDPENPALGLFPTEFHSDWQWQDIHNHSKPMVLDGLPQELEPVIQVIDDWNTCRKLGLVIEAKVGSGRLLLCSADLESDLESRPAARQLRASLLKYASSGAFDPKVALEAAQIGGLFRELSLMERLEATIVKCDSAQSGYEAANIIDGDPRTMWHTAWGDNAPGFPHEVIIGFKQPIKIQGISLTPRQDNNRNGWIREYRLDVSGDGSVWQQAARGSFEADPSEKRVMFGQPLEVRNIRLVAESTFDANDPFASLAEMELIPAE
jgi:hypothetical protein